MKRCLILLATFLSLLASPVKAHIGSPDVFFEGAIGPYSAHVTIRMPTVVPGRAEIFVRTETNQPVDVSFRPLFAWSEVSNAPPADAGKPVFGETNLYSGDLWLMTFGSYSIEVKIHGASGDGVVQIPVNSVALRQMPLPGYLGKILTALAVLLFVGGVAIVAGAARESALPPGASPSDKGRIKGWIAGTATALIIGGAVLFGNHWWKSEEKEFRRRLRVGTPPEMTAEARVEGSQRILRLNFGEIHSLSENQLQLLPDHGKLLHLFLIREGKRDAFAHLHPIRKGDKVFEVALPPLPAGRYDIFCDLAIERSGMSTTATNTVDVPEIPKTENAGPPTLDSDPDDSWAGSPADNLPTAGTATNSICGLASGQRVVWKPHAAPHVRQDAGLQFELLDAAGNPAELEPYMGMMCHAAVLRSDGAVFSHLHPSGNFSMASQGFFEWKMAHEAIGSATQSDDASAAADHSKHHGQHLVASTVSLPYEFPSAGDYRVWVQFRTGGRVLTAVFDTTVN